MMNWNDEWVCRYKLCRLARNRTKRQKQNSELKAHDFEEEYERMIAVLYAVFHARMTAQIETETCRLRLQCDMKSMS